MTPEQACAIDSYRARISAELTPPPQIARVDGREYTLQPLAPALRFYIRLFDNQHIGVGTGFETFSGDTPIIEIGEWEIIDTAGMSLKREHLSDEELKLITSKINYGPFNKEIGFGIVKLDAVDKGF